VRECLHSPKPHGQIYPSPGKKMGLVMLARKMDIWELREPNVPFFIVVYKETFLITNDSPSNLSSAIFDLSQEYEDVFLKRYHLGCHQSEALNIKLTWY
jgi:hypothetical protein